MIETPAKLPASETKLGRWKQLFTPLGRLQAMSYAEGVSLLLLVGIAVPLKYAADLPIAVSILGPIHGVAFILYSLWLAECAFAGKWKFGEVFKLWLSSFIPLGFFYSCAVIRRKQFATAQTS